MSWTSLCELSELKSGEGKYVEIKDTIHGFREIIDGNCDDIPEQAFFLQGTIEDVRKRAREMAEQG